MGKLSLKSKPRTGIVLASAIGVFLGVFGVSYLTAGEIYDQQDTVGGVHLPPVDAIVVLAGGRGRITAAGDLWVRYWELAGGKPGSPAPVLYFSGVGPRTSFQALGTQLRKGVTEVITPSGVVLEDQSRNTEENAEWFLKHVRQSGWKRVLLLTSRYHMRRARYIFERVFEANGVALAIETLSVYQDPFEPGEWRESFHGVRVTLSEYLKWLYYRRVWEPRTVK